ncbi:MAG TPA: Uma2 family endonuclease [Pyrinomonadaceae bacterium]|nr:Uma2 family endonuclease [Pyrinomonadaceae bacterium]
MQNVKTIEPLITIYDLEVLPDDGNIYELFEGELSVAKAPSLKHQELIIRLGTILTNYLDQNPVGRVWSTPGVIFDEYNSAIPDLAYIAKERIPQIASGIHIIGAPDLIIEIMSPGSENVRRDQIVKRQTYARFGVKEYWIVEPVVEIVDISRLQNNILASVGVFRNADEISSPLLPDLSFTVKDLFRK